jgi:hypothetical protein
MHIFSIRLNLCNQRIIISIFICNARKFYNKIIHYENVYILLYFITSKIF